MGSLIRNGSVADIESRPRHVRYSPQSGYSAARFARPLSARSRLRFLAFKLSQSNPIRSEVMRPLGVLIEIELGPLPQRLLGAKAARLLSSLSEYGDFQCIEI